MLRPLDGDTPPGEPCGLINECEPGSFCANGDALPSCSDSACCTQFCELGAGARQCGLVPDTVCSPFFEEGMAPAGLENLGACVNP